MNTQTKIQLQNIISLMGILSCFFLAVPSSQAEPHDPYRGLVDQNLFQRASLRADCNGNFSGLLKNVSIIQGESRTRTSDDSYGGFIVGGSGKLGGRGAVAGSSGNIVVTAAHTVIDRINGGLLPGMVDKDGNIFFYPSKALHDKPVLIDLEKSKFGCRTHYSDPLPESIKRDSIKSLECDWAILVLSEDVMHGLRHKGMGIKSLSFAENLSKDSFQRGLEDGRVSIVTANPKNSSQLFREVNCPRPVKIRGFNNTSLVAEHGCDTAPGDSGSVFTMPCSIDESYTCIAGVHTGSVSGGVEGAGETIGDDFANANRGIIFGGEFYKAFRDIHETQQRLKSSKRQSI